jgi:hypothetical protein
MFSKTALLAVSVLIGAIPGISAFASTSSGIDTPSGVANLPLAVEGLQIMTLTNTNDVGNVGIGLTNPGYTLDVSGELHVSSVTGILTTPSVVAIGESMDIGGNGFATYDASNGIEGLFGDYGAGGIVMGSFSNHNVAIRTDNTARMTILSGGNVGIGTTSPSYTLEVSGGSLVVDGTSASYNTILNGAGDTYIRAGTSSGNIIIGDQNTGEVEMTGPGNKIINGNVGIGTTSPGGNLDIENGANTAKLCLNGSCTTSVPPPFGGLYEKYCSGGCATANPYTGGCSCPSYAPNVTGWVMSSVAPAVCQYMCY